MAHSGEGFPHFNARTGACMCTSPCCYGLNGCRCGGCSGVGHVGCHAAREREDKEREAEKTVTA